MVNGSSVLPNRLFSRIAPFATPRIIPCSRVKKTTIRSASARLWLFRTRLSVSKSGICCHRRREFNGLPRDKVEHPRDEQAYPDELQKGLYAIDRPFLY